MSNAARRALGITAATFSLFAMAVGLSGCPVAADLESGPDRFPALAGSTSTGGAGPTGGTGSGGTVMGGSGGTGTVDNCERILPDPATFSCNWRAALGAPGQSPSGYCYKGGCHNATTKAGDLDLTADNFLISRLLNRPPANKITCSAGVACEYKDVAMPTCDKCAQCEQPVGSPPNVLLSSATPGTGWMFKKLEQFIPQTTTTTLPIGCGDAMPTFNTTGTNGYTQAHKDCLIAFFTEISRTAGTWPCGGAAGGGGAGGGAGAAAAGGGAGGMSTAGAGGI